MWAYLCCVWLGAVVGTGFLIFFQGVDKHDEIIEDSKKEK